MLRIPDLLQPTCFTDEKNWGPDGGDFWGPFVVQLLNCVQLFETPWTATPQAPLSFTISWSLLKLMSIESVMPSNHLILCYPLLLLPSVFPSIRIFPMSWLLASGGQIIGASASALPMNNQGWFPLELTGLFSLKFKGLSRVFSSTTIQNDQFCGTQPSLWSNFFMDKKRKTDKAYGSCYLGKEKSVS